MLVILYKTDFITLWRFCRSQQVPKESACSAATHSSARRRVWPVCATKILLCAQNCLLRFAKIFFGLFAQDLRQNALLSFVKLCSRPYICATPADSLLINGESARKCRMGLLGSGAIYNSQTYVRQKLRLTNKMTHFKLCLKALKKVFTRLYISTWLIYFWTLIIDHPVASGAASEAGVESSLSEMLGRPPAGTRQPISVTKILQRWRLVSSRSRYGPLSNDGIRDWATLQPATDSPRDSPQRQGGASVVRGIAKVRGWDVWAMGMQRRRGRRDPKLAG